MLPTFGETVYWASVVIFGYVLLGGIIERICKCFENCANAKAYGQFRAAELKSEEKKDGKM